MAARPEQPAGRQGGNGAGLPYLPAPLGYLANRPHGRYRLSCPVRFSYRAAEWAAQTASGAVAYTIWLDAVRGRWYLDASWRLQARTVPCLEALRQHPALAVDLNADHLAGWALDASGNPLGPPRTIPLALDGQPASTRDGHLRAAVAELVGLARQDGCQTIVVEDLDFAGARHSGRETLGRRARGRRFRRVVSVAVSRHHAAAVVIGRRGLGYRARRRGGCARVRPEDRIWRAVDSAGQAMASGAASAVPGVVPERDTVGDQVAQDRSMPPISTDQQTLMHQERLEWYSVAGPRPPRRARARETDGGGMTTGWSLRP